MIHLRHPTAGSRPTTSMDTRGAIMPGYTGFYPKHQHENEGIGERFSIRATNAWKTQEINTSNDAEIEWKIFEQRKSDNSNRS